MTAPRYCFHDISVLPLRLARRNFDRIQHGKPTSGASGAAAKKGGKGKKGGKCRT
jgi:hypothetical protein